MIDLIVIETLRLNENELNYSTVLLYVPSL